MVIISKLCHTAAMRYCQLGNSFRSLKSKPDKRCFRQLLVAGIVVTTSFYVLLCGWCCSRPNSVRRFVTSWRPYTSGGGRVKDLEIDNSTTERYKRLDLIYGDLRENMLGNETSSLEEGGKIKLLLNATLEYMQQTEMIINELSNRKESSRRRFLKFLTNPNLTKSLIKNDKLVGSEKPPWHFAGMSFNESSGNILLFNNLHL